MRQTVTFPDEATGCTSAIVVAHQRLDVIHARGHDGLPAGLVDLAQGIVPALLRPQALPPRGAADLGGPLQARILVAPVPVVEPVGGGPRLTPRLA